MKVIIEGKEKQKGYFIHRQAAILPIVLTRHAGEGVAGDEDVLSGAKKAWAPSAASGTEAGEQGASDRKLVREVSQVLLEFVGGWEQSIITPPFALF